MSDILLSAQGLAKAYTHLGGVYRQQGNPAEAIKHLNNALQLNKDLSGAHFDMGRVLEAQDEGAKVARAGSSIGARSTSV